MSLPTFDLENINAVTTLFFSSSSLEDSYTQTIEKIINLRWARAWIETYQRTPTVHSSMYLAYTCLHSKSTQSKFVQTSLQRTENTLLDNFLLSQANENEFEERGEAIYGRNSNSRNYYYRVSHHEWFPDPTERRHPRANIRSSSLENN